MENQYVVCTTGYSPLSTLEQKIVNPIALIFIQTWRRRIGHLGYQNILRLLKVADGIEKSLFQEKYVVIV